MLNLMQSLGSLLLTGLVLGGLFIVPAATTPPENAPLPVPDVLFYGTATANGQVLESGTVEAVLPRGKRITSEIAPIPGTNYNYAFSVPLRIFDNPDTATWPPDAVVAGDMLRFTLDGRNAFYKDAQNMDVQNFTIPWNAMGATYILNLRIASPNDYMMGDVNANGYRDVADALLILRYSVGFVAGDEEFPPASGKPYLPLCDVVRDGVCNAADAERILQCEAGLPGIPCLPADAPPIITQTLGAPPLFRLEVVPDSGAAITRTVQVVANRTERTLGAASLKLLYDPAHLTVDSCAAAPTTEMSRGVCYAAPDAGNVHLNYVAVNGIHPDVVLGEITFAPVGDYDLEQLANALDLRVNNAFDLDGAAFVWPEAPPPSLDNILFLPLVMQGQ